MTTMEEAGRAGARGGALLGLLMPSMHEMAGEWDRLIEADGRRAIAGGLSRESVASVLHWTHQVARTRGHDMRWVAETYRDLLVVMLHRSP